MKLTPQRVNEVVLFWNRGNDIRTIAKITELSENTVKKIVSNVPMKLPPIIKNKELEKREKIEEFERVLREKKGSDIKGKELWDKSKARHVDYKESWDSDAVVSFNFKNKYIGIATIADAHIGHEGVDLFRLEKDQDIIDSTDNMYVACLGDMMDLFLDATKHQEAVLNANNPPKDQLYMFRYWLSRFKNASSKILFVTKDNHVHARLKKACGIDFTNGIWDDLNVFYGGEQILANINVGDVNYKMLSRHSYKGGSRIDVTKACRELLMKGKHEDVDIVALGHTHRGALEYFQYRDKMRVAVQASTYKTYDPYGAGLGFDPSVIFMPVLILSPFSKSYYFADSVESGSKLLKKLNSK
jgi:predicted phosphodiesterase